MEKTKIKHVYIIGSKGIPAKYGGFESFVENLTKGQTDKTIQYHIACMTENSLKSDIKEKEFISTAKQVKLGNYCICMQSIGDMFPYWQNKSAYANLVIAYILKNIQLYGNYVEISEKEFVNCSGISARSFYNAINALLRPALPYPCAGDNLALLAATTKKSIYVVNHNFIFRGNYDEFVTLYELKFPNGCKLDSKGRVIIER